MSIIEQSRDEYGLNRCLQALSVAKSSWHYRQDGYSQRGAKEKEMESEMRYILVDHPDYGRPRMTIELRDRLGYAVNHKRVGRLLQDQRLEADPEPAEAKGERGFSGSAPPKREPGQSKGPRV